jgi:hypothetical protein
VLGAIGDFVVDGFDFAGEVKILRVLCVRGEERVPSDFQVIVFLLPNTCSSNHGFNSGMSVRLFMVGR